MRFYILVIWQKRTYLYHFKISNYVLFYVKSIRIGVTSRSALGFMAHAGPQRRGIVREHFVVKGILKQTKAPSNIEYINLKCRLIPITTQDAKRLSLMIARTNAYLAYRYKK